MIWRLLSNCWYSVFVNGQYCGFFTSYRCLRQGDPMSPYLFIISTDVFSRGLDKMHVLHNSLRYYSTNVGVPISHLAYAVDVIIFYNGETKSLKQHMKFLQKFHNFPGLEINRAKSFFAIGAPNVPKDTIIRSIIVFQKTDLPLNYLGCPLYKGIITKRLFLLTLEKMREKLCGWKGKMISPGGKLTLIKSVLAAMPSYLLALIQPLKAMVHALHKIMSDILWHDSSGQHIYHWIK